jgi:hypothetical protein
VVKSSSSTNTLAYSGAASLKTEKSIIALAGDNFILSCFIIGTKKYLNTSNQNNRKPFFELVKHEKLNSYVENQS